MYKWQHINDSKKVFLFLFFIFFGHFKKKSWVWIRHHLLLHTRRPLQPAGKTGSNKGSEPSQTTLMHQKKWDTKIKIKRPPKPLQYLNMTLLQPKYFNHPLPKNTRERERDGINPNSQSQGQKSSGESRMSQKSDSRWLDWWSCGRRMLQEHSWREPMREEMGRGDVREEIGSSGAMRSLRCKLGRGDMKMRASWRGWETSSYQVPRATEFSPPSPLQWGWRKLCLDDSKKRTLSLCTMPTLQEVGFLWNNIKNAFIC